MIGLVSGTVSASARSLGHVISFWITLFLMFVVFCVLGKEAFWGPRSYAPCKERFGPLAVFVFAALLIMVDPSVHLMGDTRAWPWCGNNAQFDRINDTAGWNAQCDASSTHYVCTIACCVSTWQNTSAADDTSYGWLPPSADFYSGPDSGPIPGPFGTLRPDGSVFTPAGSGGPFMLYTATTERPLLPTMFQESLPSQHEAPQRILSKVSLHGKQAAGGPRQSSKSTLPKKSGNSSALSTSLAA